MGQLYGALGTGELVIRMFIKVPDVLSGAAAPAGSEDRLLSGTPGSSSYLSLDDYADDQPTDGYEVPDLIPRKRCQFEVSLSIHSVVDRLLDS